MKDAPILIMAGGTGGHVFPALAVAHELIALNRSVVWLGTRRGIENRLVPAAGISLEHIRVAGLRRKGALSWLLAPFNLVVAIWDALRIVRRRRPSVVLGMGGFASGPGGVAAWLLRRPLVIHEQNAAPGLTNRLLAGLAREVLQAFPGSFSPGVKVRAIGNPVRRELFAVAPPADTAEQVDGSMRLLILGGSQGAKVLNEIVPAAVGQIAGEVALEIWHQAGSRTVETALQAYRDSGVDARVDTFIDDMAKAYSWADMVICRSGALTVSELAAVGRGAVLVPYPSAVDDHQTLNARFLVDAGAAVLLPQARLTAETLATEIRKWAADRRYLIECAATARSLAAPDATTELADICLAQEAA